MNRLLLGLRLLARDGRSGELNLLTLALIIAVGSATAISLFADRLQRTMGTQAAEFLAADLVVASPDLIPLRWLHKAQALDLNAAKTAEFSTVLIENDELLLVGAKAVSDQYPLRGMLKTSGTDYRLQTSNKRGPKAGEAWIDKRILSALKLDLGDTLRVGEKSLQVTRLISYEPDKRGDLYSLSPRVMLAYADLEATQVLKPGSHVHYFFQFSGSAQAIKQFNRWLKPQLNAGQRLMDIHQDRPELGAAISRAEQYLGLFSILVVFIAGVAIAMSARRYSERHFNTTAVLRCLGCKQQEIIGLYLSQFIVLGLFASAIGVGFGWLTQESLFYLLRDLLPNKVAHPSFIAILFGLISGQAILLAFALPPLLRLKKVSPLRVLHKDLDPLPSSAWLVYLLVATLLSTLIWRYTEDAKLTVTVIGVGFIGLASCGLALQALLVKSKKIVPYLGLSWRFGLQSMVRNPSASVSQILAFSITLTAMILSFTVRTDLLNDWKSQLPANAPNYFVLNIFPQQLSGFKRQLQQQNINNAQFYPVVRGRLVKINGVGVQQIVSKDSKGERATHRDLSLTWATQPPPDNKTIAGSWNAEQPGQLSIEQKLAESLRVKLGDKLTFTLGSQQLDATVFHIRSVQWDSMKPNFYMLFTPTTLDRYASTFITSFYLAEHDKNLLNLLAKQFPGITVLEVDAMLKQFQLILNQLTTAISYLLYFALAAGFTVLFATIYSTLDARILESTLLRTLGASRRLLNKAHWVEFSLLGVLSGCIAVLLSELIIYALYTFVLHLDYAISGLLWWSVPLVSIFCVVLAGSIGVRKVVKQSPMQVLQDL